MIFFPGIKAGCIRIGDIAEFRKLISCFIIYINRSAAAAHLIRLVLIKLQNLLMRTLPFFDAQILDYFIHYSIKWGRRKKWHKIHRNSIELRWTSAAKSSTILKETHFLRGFVSAQQTGEQISHALGVAAILLRHGGQRFPGRDGAVSAAASSQLRQGRELLRIDAQRKILRRRTQTRAGGGRDVQRSPVCRKYSTCSSSWCALLLCAAMPSSCWCLVRMRCVSAV